MNAFAVMSTVATTFTRFSGQRAIPPLMANDWKRRLLEAIDSDPRSGRELSRALKMGPNTISELRKTDKTPSFDKVLALIDLVGASRSYVILGYEMDQQSEEILRLLATVSPKAREGFASFLLEKLNPAEKPEPQPDPARTSAENPEGSR